MAVIAYGLVALPAPPALAASVIASGPITSGITGYCLDDGAGLAVDGNKIDLWPCTGYAAAQTWQVMDDGTIQINGMCMDVAAGGTGNGTPIDLYTCNGSGAQQWQPQGNELVNSQSGLCLDDPNGQTADAPHLQLWDCSGGTNQQWNLPSDSTGSDGGPCDIYGAAGTPCVAAYSTVRALYSSYNGPLYQLRRVSDGAMFEVGLLTAGGYADAAEQDAFCARSACIVSELYDQSPEHNDLTIEGPGGAAGQDVGANAAALPIVAGGHKVYGLYIAGQTGYRDNSTQGIVVNGEPEGMYMVASGTHVNSGCCFDFGNAETNTSDNGNGRMDAVNLGTQCGFAPCSGSGPWVQADMENGLFSGGNGSNTANLGNNSDFVTAMLKNDGQTTYALKGGNAQSGGLTTWWDGALPDIGGYTPMSQEGAIVLGTGGDNSNWSVGSFFEGVMTAGYPSDAADNEVQANIVSASYSGASSGGAPPAGTITGPAGQCVDVGGDDSGTDGAVADLWNCQSYAIDQRWTHNSDDSLSTLGRCVDINGNGTAAGTKVGLWDCNGTGGQKWVQQQNGSLLNPQSGLCLDDPGGNTANGTQLQIWPCNGASAQVFSINGGGMIEGPGGQCVDVAGDDAGGDHAYVQLSGCRSYAIDQHWYHHANGSLETLGRCLNIEGDGTAVGAKVELWDCNGTGGQVWQQQPDGSLLNPQSGLCLDDPDGNTADGTQLQIWTCIGDAAQQFALS